MNGTRAFLAIELPLQVKAELSRIQSLLKQATTCPVKWVYPEGIHLTLSFLGEISQAQIEAVKGVMAQAASQESPFQLKLAHMGAFPNTKQPQILWVGFQGELGILSRLHKRLEDGLRSTGYKPEERSFKPHLTLARVRDEATVSSRQELGEALSRISVCVSQKIDVSEISLMKSELSRSGPVYTRLYTEELNGK